MALIPADRFRTFAPQADESTRAALEQAATAAGFKGLVLAHWLGQMHVESAGFTTRTENLNYSATALIKMFGRHRISEADALKFGRTSEHPAHQNAIANIIYGGEWGRKNLGNTEPGDGWRYRGGGDKQITGRANFREAGHEDDPDTLRSDPVASAKAAAGFFVKHGCVAPALRDDVAAVTKLVNGGSNGLAERVKQTLRAKKVIGL